MDNVIEAFTGERVIKCPKCGSLLFYAVLEPDWMSANRLECGEDSCNFTLKFVDNTKQGERQ